MKRILVTGGTGAIGEAIVEGLLKKGCRVIFTARDEMKAEKLMYKLGPLHKKAGYKVVNLAEKAEVFSLADSWSGPLHVMINNAACAPRMRKTNASGIELMWATNVLAYYWMIEAFSGKLRAPGKKEAARIVNVASFYAGSLDFSDPEFKMRRFNNNSAYRAGKQANRMLTRYFAQKLLPDNILVNACHPGEVNSALSNGLGFGGHESPEKGAETPIYCAVDPAVEGQTGNFFVYLRKEPCGFMEDRNGIESLISLCSSY